MTLFWICFIIGWVCLDKLGQGIPDASDQCGWRPNNKIHSSDYDSSNADYSPAEDDSDSDSGSPPQKKKKPAGDGTGEYPSINLVYKGLPVKQRSQHPWIVRVSTTMTNNEGKVYDQRLGTGFIVGRQWVLTAAHLVYNHTIKKAFDSAEIMVTPERTLSVEKMIYPSNEAVYHNGIVLIDDIALLKLNAPIKYSSELQPLCLMTEFDERPYSTTFYASKEELEASKERAEVVGYGYTELPPQDDKEDTRKSSDVAYRGQMRFMDPLGCIETFLDKNGEHEEKPEQKTSSEYDRICLWNKKVVEEVWAEEGDSGSPAVWCPILIKKEYQNQMQQMQRCAAVGIQSAISSLIAKDSNGMLYRAPVKFVRISRHCKWIEEKTDGEVKCIPPLEEEGVMDANDRDSFLRNKMFPMAAAAYGDETSIKKCLNNIWLKSTFNVDHNGYQLSCFIALSHTERAIIVSFRGTTSRKQLVDELFDGYTLTKLKADGREFEEKVVTAFGEFYTHLEEEYLPVLKKQIGKYPDYQVWFTGHSLGGALAAISNFAFVAANRETPRKTVLATFGQPRTGNEAFARSFESNMTSIFRVVHRRDGVVRVPFHIEEIEADFHHAGAEVFYDSADMSGSGKLCPREDSDTESCGIMEKYKSIVIDLFGQSIENAVQMVKDYFNKAYESVMADKPPASTSANIGGEGSMELMGMDFATQIYEDHINYYGKPVSEYGKNGCK